MVRELICISCPRGCHLKVDDQTLEVTGNQCIRGKNYGVSEVTNPVRTITSTCKVNGGIIPRVSCKTDNPVSKQLIFEVMDKINEIEVEAPVTIGQILIENVLGTGSNIIATKSVAKR